MNAVICWKEYRQQRALWLASGALGILLAAAVAQGLGHGPAVFHRQLVSGLILTVALAHALAGGALLLAGEKEDATLGFLDTLPAERHAVWWAKARVGLLLATSEAILLGGFGVAAGYLPWQLAVSMPLLSADGLVWGLLAGALCGNVLVAVFAGIAMLAATWLASTITGTLVGLVILKVALASIGLIASRRSFGGPDLERRRSARRLGLPAETAQTNGWGSLAWLVVRQGRWVLVLTTVAAIIFGCMVNLLPLICYPATTLIVGLVCGLATFAPEQGGRQQLFLGAQRLPPGKLWAFKIAFWGLAAFYLSAIVWGIGVGVLMFNRSQSTGQTPSWEDAWWGGAQVDGPFLLCLWVLHGFCLGQFSAFWASRPVIAAIVATALGAASIFFWLPSVLFGGLEYWQVLGAPILLLVGTRLYFWTWLTGGLGTARAWAGLIGVSALALLWTIAGLAYRVLEVPDASALVNLDKLGAEIPSPERNEAGLLIRRAALEFHAHADKVDAELWAKGKRSGPSAPSPAGFGGIEGGPGAAPPQEADDVYVDEVLQEGWPKDDRRLRRWLDLMCAGQWFTDIQRAARLPLGVVDDPRRHTMLDLHREHWNYRQLVNVLIIRALELVADGKTAPALDYLDTLLALSRQLRNYSGDDFWGSGCHLECHVVKASALWLRLGPDADQLRTALAMLERHEKQRPGTRPMIVANHFTLKNSVERDPTTILNAPGHVHASTRELWQWAWQVPWERARQERLGLLILAVWLQNAQTPYWQTPWANRDRMPGTGTWANIAFMHGLTPPAEGPGSGWSAARWGKALMHSWLQQANVSHLHTPYTEVLLRAQMLTTALVLHQAEKGSLPEKLDDLVPGCLASLPVDPFSGGPFHYRISNGETIARPSLGGAPDNKQVLTLAPGQGVVWRNMVSGELAVAAPYVIVQGSQAFMGVVAPSQQVMFFPVPLGSESCP